MRRRHRVADSGDIGNSFKPCADVAVQGSVVGAAARSERGSTNLSGDGHLWEREVVIRDTVTTCRQPAISSSELVVQERRHLRPDQVVQILILGAECIVRCHERMA